MRIQTKGIKDYKHIPKESPKNEEKEDSPKRKKGLQPESRSKAYIIPFQDSLRKRSTASLTGTSSRRRSQDYSRIKKERGL